MRPQAYALLGLALSLAACAETRAPEPRDVSDEIRPLAVRFEQAFAQRNAAELASLYTADAQVLPPGSEAVSGRAGIQQVWQGAFDAGLAGVTLTVVEATAVGETAFEVGRYVVTDASGAPIDEGKYVVIWRREGDTWRLHRDIWNSSRPTP